jgi:hypothetical protein
MLRPAFTSPKSKPKQQSRNKRRTEWNVVRQNAHKIIPGFLQGIFLEDRAGKVLNPQPIDLHNSGVSEHLQGDEKQSKKHEGDPANFAQRESNCKSGDTTKTDLSQVRRELIEDFLIHARSISIFWCDPGEWIQNGTEARDVGILELQSGVMFSV